MNRARIIHANPTFFSAKEIAAFERTLLANPNATEHDASKFFASHPAFLGMGVGAKLRREVAILGLNTAYRADFFRKSYGNPYWDLIELKGPNHPVIAASGGMHPILSRKVFEAIEQALDYRDLIVSDNGAREHLALKDIVVCRPRLVVIVGQDPKGISPEQFEVLLDRVRARGAVELITYTAVHRFAVEHFKANSVLIEESIQVSPSIEVSVVVSPQDASPIEQSQVVHHTEVTNALFNEIRSDIFHCDTSKPERIRSTLAANVNTPQKVARLFVGNIPLIVEAEELRAMFEEVGETVDFFWPKNRDSGRKSGFAFVDVAENDVEKVLEACNGKDTMGHQLAVNRARAREDR